MDKPDYLTDKQWDFVVNLPVLDWNGTKAYHKAYGQQKNDNIAASGASRLLRNPKIREALKGAYEQAAMPLEEMLFGLSEIARNESNDLHARLRAYEMIGKGHSAFTSVVKSDTNLNINVRFDREE